MATTRSAGPTRHLLVEDEDTSHADGVADASLSLGIVSQAAAATGDNRPLPYVQSEYYRLTSALLSMQDGLCLVDKAGQITFCNPQLGKILGGHAEGLVGHSYRVLFEQVAAHSGNVEKARRDLDMALEERIAFPAVNVTLVSPDLRHLQFHFFSLGDQTGRIHGWGAVVHDVTREREQLKWLYALLSNISHELRSPLAAIKGFVSMLSGTHSYWDEEGRQAFLENINESADQLGQLIENVLEMSRLDAGVTWLHRHTISLERLIQRVVQMVSVFGKDHDFEICVPPDLPELEVDPLRIEQVMRNLLIYAVKASPPGSKVVVSSELRESEILISVNGREVAIPNEYLTHIFENFPQVSQLWTGQSLGLSLSLYICRELVVAHGGRIWADNESGKGTTIHFTLPLERTANLGPIAVQPTLGQTVKRAHSTAHPAWDATTVLIVEDDLEMLRFLKTSVEAEGCKVFIARQGRVALEMMTQWSFDLVLLNVRLPDLDGFQLCDRLREFSAVPVIMIAAGADEREEVRALNLGADDYLAKPFSHKELLARMRAILRRSRAHAPGEELPVLHRGDLALDFARRQVLLRGHVVNLSRYEYKLLHHLAANMGHVLSHEQLLTEVWGPEYANESHYLWVSISRLRKKLEDDSREPRYILTEPGVGYRFCEA